MKDALEMAINNMKEALILLHSDALKVSSPISKELILKEVESMKRRLEKREFDLWRLTRGE